jgi:Tannase and feruloyl esterase
LPTTGAVVDNAVLVAATAAGNSNGEYCMVKGSIHPVAATAPDIKFELNLPTTWNQRALHFGGGGYNGSLVSGLGAITFAPLVTGLGTASPVLTTPLSQGYATYGSDSGHQSTAAALSADASFALNDEALVNFGYAHIKKTHDVATRILTVYFGSNTAFKTYFAGGSTGGRESLTAIQRFPADYDGAFVGAPTAIFWGIRMIGFPVGRAAYGTAGGYLNPAKQALVVQRSVAACDLLDGVADGLVSNVPACQALAASTLASLRCAGGLDTGNTCLSDLQIAVVNALHNGLTLPYAMAFNSTRCAGYNVLEGTDFSLNATTLGLGTSATLLEPPTTTANGYLFAQGVQWLRYFVSKDPAFNPLAFDPLAPAPTSNASSTCRRSSAPRTPICRRSRRGGQADHAARRGGQRGEPERLHRLLRQAGREVRTGAARRVRPLLSRPRNGTRRRRLRAGVGRHGSARRLGDHGLRARYAAEHRHRRGNGRADAAAVRLSQLAQVQRIRRRQCGQQLHMQHFLSRRHRSDA